MIKKDKIKIEKRLHFTNFYHRSKIFITFSKICNFAWINFQVQVEFGYDIFPNY